MIINVDPGGSVRLYIIRNADEVKTINYSDIDPVKIIKLKPKGHRI
jgi:hypothetical protein